MNNIPFQIIDWKKIIKTEHPGETGTSFWQTMEFAGLRVRMVEYGAGYFADHWCRKGHVVHCLGGSFTTELESGETCTLTAGMSYIVSDNMSSHRSLSAAGVRLLIIDGDFLQQNLSENTAY